MTYLQCERSQNIGVCTAIGYYNAINCEIAVLFHQYVYVRQMKPNLKVILLCNVN